MNLDGPLESADIGVRPALYLNLGGQAQGEHVCQEGHSLRSQAGFHDLPPSENHQATHRFLLLTLQ